MIPPKEISPFFEEIEPIGDQYRDLRIESRSLRSTTTDNNHEFERNNRHRLSRATRSKQWIGEQETAGNTNGRTHQHPLRLCDRLTLSTIR